MLLVGAGLVEEILRVVGLEPLLEVSELLVIGLRAGEGDLVRREAVKSKRQRCLYDDTASESPTHLLRS